MKTIHLMLIVIPFCVSAEAQTIGDIWGTAKSITSVIGGFIGTTTVTPAYAMKTWRKDSYGYYGNVYFDSRWRVSRSMVTGAYFYDYRNLRFDGTWSVNQAPFSISTVQRLNYYCNLSTYYPDGSASLFIYNDLRDFEIAVWAGAIVKTGYFPPGQPYTAELKSVATRLQTSCKSIPPLTRETRKDVQINDTGYVTTKMDLVSYDYSWPMLCWIGSTYDY